MNHPPWACARGTERAAGSWKRTAGTLQALGLRLLNAEGLDLRPGGRELARLARIDSAGPDPRVGAAEMLVACNPCNMLCGDHDVARALRKVRRRRRPRISRPWRRWTALADAAERAMRMVLLGTRLAA